MDIDLNPAGGARVPVEETISEPERAVGRHVAISPAALKEIATSRA
jgi:hypothetical protein